jgi:hypothetical protein
MMQDIYFFRNSGGFGIFSVIGIIITIIIVSFYMNVLIPQ